MQSVVSSSDDDESSDGEAKRAWNSCIRLLKHSKSHATYVTVIALLRQDFSNQACVLEYALHNGTIAAVCNKMFFDVDEKTIETKTPRKKKEEKKVLSTSMDDDALPMDDRDSIEIFRMSL